MSWFWNKHDDLELARFVIHAKDSEAVQTFIEKAVQSSHLPQSDYDFHQTQNDGRKQIIEKIYNALRQHEIEYALNEYHELSGDRQLIRTPKEILDTQRRGTCLDLAILFSAICWHYDLLPILTLVEGHALVAVSLTHSLRDWENEERREQQLFWEGQGKLTDSNKLQKMVNREDYLAIECTGFAKSETLSEGEDKKFQRVDGFLSFDQAVELGRQQLTRPLKFALDIHIAYNFWWSKVVCQNRLEAEPIKRLINSPLANGENPLLKLYVPLGLIERKPDAQRRPFENASPPEESPFNKPDDQYEVVREYEHKEFFDEVLKQKSSSRSQGKRLAIVGDPGGGKTTLLQRIAYWVLEEEQGLPIWVPLGDVNKNWVQGRDETDEGWLYRYLSENWLRNVAGEPEKTPKELQQAFKELLKSGQVWLLLDGADEMALKSPLMRIKEQLAKGWADSVRVVLNCRLNLWEVEKEALWEKFDIYRTLDFSYPEQVHEFINKRFGEDNPAAKRLQDKLAEENRKRLQDLVKNPLRLALLCRIWKESLGSLPDTKADFYRLLVENHYKWKDDSTNEEFEIPEDRKKELNQALGQLARDAIDSENFRFRLRESSVRKYLKDPNERFSLFGWALKLGWLLNVGFPTEGETNLGEKVYAFFHPTFQEYFAATRVDNYDFFLPMEHRHRPVKDKDNQGKYKRYRIFERQWKEVILLWLGRPEREVSDKQKEEFIQALVEFKDGCECFYWYRSYFLAAAGIAEFGDCSCADEVIEKLITWKFGATNLDKNNYHISTLIKNGAEVALLETHHQKVIDALTKRLNSCLYNDKSLEIALTLIQKAPGNPVAVKVIVDYLERSQKTLNPSKIFDLKCVKVLSILRNFSADNSMAIDALNRLSPDNDIDEHRTSTDLLNDWRDDWKDFVSLSQSLTENEVDIIKLEKRIESSNDIHFLFWLLKKVVKKEFPQTLNHNQSRSIISLVNNRLFEISSRSSEAVTLLLEIIHTSHDEHICQELAFVLGKAASRNIDATKSVIKLLKTTKDEYIAECAIECLKKVFRNDLLAVVVEGLKDYIEYTECYKLIWHCAQNMPYPDFYKAWHQQEGLDNTTTLNSQSLNQANLQESLQSAIANEPQLNQTIHLFCIDTRKFIDPNNPAAKIYVEMVKQGCCKSGDGTPKTMQDLQVYWDLLTIESDSEALLRSADRTIVLVFYTSSDNPTVIHFSQI